MNMPPTGPLEVPPPPVAPVAIDALRVGDDCPLLLIAGPCVLENEELTFQIADHLAAMASRLPIQLVFKASFDKANRTSGQAYRGPGMETGLAMLDRVRTRTGLPVTTDIHESHQAGAVAEVCALLQIPAFLARQTDLLLAAAATRRTLNIKKGQFMAPHDMRNVVEKLRGVNAHGVMLCERGTFFGYGQLVNDMRGLVEMRQLGVPVVFDATHSVQQPGGLGNATGGNRRMVPPLARAAAAVGIDGLFVETHPHPDRSPSDGPNMIPLDQIEQLVRQVLAIREVWLAIRPTPTNDSDP